MPIRTERLLLTPLTRSMIEARMVDDDFDLEVDLDGPRSVRFPPGWPGDALGMFARQLAAMTPDGHEDPDSFVAIERTRLVALGQLGTKGAPDAAGVVEIGYGFAPEAHGQGYGTEAVRALVTLLLARREVAAVTAATAVWNRASERVLEKTGFHRTGTGWEAEDGDLVLWRTESPPA